MYDKYLDATPKLKNKSDWSTQKYKMRISKMAKHTNKKWWLDYHPKKVILMRSFCGQGFILGQRNTHCHSSNH